MRFVVLVLALAGLSAAQGGRTFTGVITDNMCAKEGHASMRMGPTDADCTTACVSAHGADYVLYNGESTYKLSTSRPLEAFAGQKVTVRGVLDAKANTIRVESIARAQTKPAR